MSKDYIIKKPTYLFKNLFKDQTMSDESEGVYRSELVRLAIAHVWQ